MYSDTWFVQVFTIAYYNIAISLLRNLSQPLKLSWFDIYLPGMDWTLGHGFFTSSPN